ncbi:MAG TPA: hypothetical protein VKO35_00670, partial [Acidimicrobiia bacterium]|nr:hypothetical protein [Acidimicrobiia bacterium]
MNLDAATEEALDRLYAAPPDRFTAERDALAKSLKATDKAAAAAVKALRRPPVTAWALNQVSRDHAADLSALFDADAELSRSQREGAGRDALARGHLTGDLTPGSLWETGFASETAPGSAGQPGGEPDEAGGAQRRRERQRRAEELAAEAKWLGSEASRLEADAAK